MVSARRPLDGPVVWSLAAPFAAIALGTGLQIDAPDSSPTTTIERAVIEYRCSPTRLAGALETDAYRECSNAQLSSLRADFGHDLKRLSSSERKTIDSSCHRVREAEGPDAYLACLSNQLASLGHRHRRPSPALAEASPPPAEAALPPPLAVGDPPIGSTPPTHSALWRSPVLWVGTGLAAVFLTAGGVLVARKAQRAPRQCRACGTDISDSGDLCPTCRHEAAEARRHLGIERADAQRAQEEERRRQREQEEEQHRERSREEEETRLPEDEQAGAAQEAQTRHDAQLQRREEAEKEAGQRREAGVSPQQAFDPHAVLGVSPDASQDEIRAAYQEAKMKYDADEVSHLSIDVQEHYKAKAQAVERAYQQLRE